MSKAEKEEKERQVMRVAFEESGEVVGKAGATSSMEMTAMDFRSIVASDEARAFREDAARRILRGGLLLLPGFQSLHQDDGKHFSSNMDLSFSFVYDWLPWENICIPCLTLKASLPPENGCLEYNDPFLLGFGQFSGALVATRWWFQIFLKFSPLCGEDEPIFD